MRQVTFKEHIAMKGLMSVSKEHLETMSPSFWKERTKAEHGIILLFTELAHYQGITTEQLSVQPLSFFEAIPGLRWSAAFREAVRKADGKTEIVVVVLRIAGPWVMHSCRRMGLVFKKDSSSSSSSSSSKAALSSTLSSLTTQVLVFRDSGGGETFKRKVTGLLSSSSSSS
jgi:hypothetical protein